MQQSGTRTGEKASPYMATTSKADSATAATAAVTATRMGDGIHSFSLSLFYFRLDILI